MTQELSSVSPMISIIVPVYNVERYIERCFYSILALNYKNIECIFIDDGSGDNSCKILEELIKNHAKENIFSIIKHTENKGQSAARNTGIREAKGEYIFLMDSDDEITPNSISALVGTLQKYPDSEIIQGAIKQTPFARHIGDWYDISKIGFKLNCKNSKHIKKMFFSFPRIPVSIWGKLICRKFLTENSLFLKEGIMNEDDEWSFRAGKCIKSLSFCKEICYIYYNAHPNSIMNTTDLSRRIYSWLIILNDMLNSLDNEVIAMQLRFIDSLALHVLCYIKSDKKYSKFLQGYKEVYDKLKPTKRKHPLAYIPNKFYIKMKIKQILGNKLSKLIRKTLHRHN